MFQVEGTAIGFMSISDDVNIDLLNQCFELGPLHGLRKPHPEDELTPPKTPSPSPPPQGKFKDYVGIPQRLEQIKSVFKYCMMQKKA